jgi:hypothetical protein
VLTRFGADEAQLPYFGEGNCHNWAADAVAALEEAGLTAPGDGEKWAAMIGKGPLAMETSWTRNAGRQWVPCEKFNRARPDVIDARWGDSGDDLIAPRSYCNTPDFKDRMRRLQDLLHGGKPPAGVTVLTTES